MSNSLTTVEEIKTRLLEVSPDQVGVIEGMALTRGFDPNTMPIKAWRDMIIEESEASFEPTEPRESEVYSRKLQLIAKNIAMV